MDRPKEKENEKGHWLTILDYAVQKNISVSTIRGHLKNHKVPFKLVEGRYLIYSEDYSESHSSPFTSHSPLDKGVAKLKKENESLRNEIKHLKEEMCELRMLVTVYERSLQAFSEDDIVLEKPYSV